MAESDVKVIVIGGGISGLSAAVSLLKCGFNDVQILEASSRLGGRIKTDNIDGDNIDYGAQYLHGCYGNPLHTLAEANNLLNVVDGESSSSSENDESEGSTEWQEYKYMDFYTQEGEKVPRQLAVEVCTIVDRILEEADLFARAHRSLEEPDESVGSFTHDRFQVGLNHDPELRDESIIQQYLETIEPVKRRVVEGIYRWRMLQEKTDNACRSLFELSLYGWGEYEELPGDRYSELRKGFSSLIGVLLKDIPQNKIHLNAVVREIKWDQRTTDDLMAALNIVHADKKALLTATNNNDINATAKRKVKITTYDGREYVCDHVIVTCSLGVLKRHSETLFQPLLPKDKLAAIHRMGFGTVNKLILQYNKPWWSDSIDGVQFAWLKDVPLKLKSEGAEWFRGIQGFDTTTSPRLLIGWIAGEEAEIMESKSDKEVLDVCHELLQMFTKRHLPRPKRLLRSRWRSEPFVRGSYSYLKAGSDASDCEILAKPVPNSENPRVLFAGEATHSRFFSSSHGAYLTGQREAQRIKELYNVQECS